MRLVGEDMLDIVFATRILLGIALGLLVNVTIILSFTLKLKLIIGLVIRSVFKARGSRLKRKEAYVVEPYIYYFSKYTYILIGV
jgi:hypothetical protein